MSAHGPLTKQSLQKAAHRHTDNCHAEKHPLASPLASGLQCMPKDHYDQWIINAVYRRPAWHHCGCQRLQGFPVGNPTRWLSMVGRDQLSRRTLFHIEPIKFDCCYISSSHCCHGSRIPFGFPSARLSHIMDHEGQNLPRVPIVNIRSMHASEAS